MTFDVSRVRAAYPALSDGYAYLDGAGGTQVPTAVIEAIAETYRSGIGNAGGAFPASGRADSIVAECRRAIADLTGAEPDGVILGPNMTTLTYRLADTLSRQWGPGDEVVVSRLDHDANVRPWVQAAARSGATVRWAEVDLSTAELPAAQFGELLSERTRLVAVTAASNIVGTRPDVPAIAAAAHAVGALCYVDGVHATPHVPVDVRALGADFYATSAYKWSGPHIGTVVADPALLETLHPDKLAPAPSGVPGRFERGTAAFADLAGVAAAVDHLAALDALRRRQPQGAGAGVHGRRGAVRGTAVHPPARRPGRDAARDAVRQGRAAHADGVLHRGRVLRRARSRPGSRTGRSTCGTATTTRGSWLARSACGIPAAASAPGSSTTTTRPRSTGCWPPSRSLASGGVR